MRHVSGKDLGGINFNTTSGILKLGKTDKAGIIQQQNNNCAPIQMTGIYSKNEISAPQVKSTVTIPDQILANYQGIGEASSYRPGGTNQTEAFYNGLKQEPVNDTDRASNKYLEEQAFS